MIYAINPRWLWCSRGRMLDQHLPGAALGMVASWRAGAPKSATQLGKNITLLASITKEGGMGPCLRVEGGTTKEVFEA